MRTIRDFCDEVEELIVGNEIFDARTRGIGVLPAEVAMSYGVAGANLRASGVDWDHRRDTPTPLVYDELDWRVWTHPDGDSFARYWVRLQEVREAALMVEQLCAGLPAGPIMAKVPGVIKVPPGEAWSVVDAPLVSCV
jgi:NADH-quinone oxidoreductase subunit D